MKSISIIVPAYNEEKNLRGAVDKYERIAKELFDDYEIIIVNDGSSDGTGVLADQIQVDYNNAGKPGIIRVRHHQENKGLGAAFKTGLEMAKNDYIILLSGEGDPSEEGVRNILNQVGKADIIISYMSNERERPWYRRLATKTMTTILNVRFHTRLKYYSGFVLYKREMLKDIVMDVNNSAYQAQILVQLLNPFSPIRKGDSYNKVTGRFYNTYLEVPYNSDACRGKSNVFKPKNIWKVGKTLIKMMMRGY